MPYQIGVLLGDDIGPEVVPEAVKVARHAAQLHGVDISWHQVPIGLAALHSHGSTLPSGTLDFLSTLDGWVLGPIGHRAYPKDPRAINPHPVLRKHFNLFANIRPLRSFANVPSLHKDVDIIVLRENNEGFQPDRNMFRGLGEYMPTEDLALSTRVISRQASQDVARAAFELARSRRSRVTAVHKDTVFKLSCGLFAEACRQVAAEYPDCTYDEAIVDTFAMQLIMHPQDYDVVVTTNLFGDILSDVAAGLVGGLGLAPGLSAGHELAMAQATHGSAPDIAGCGVANPFAMISSVQLLLDWLARRHSDPGLLSAAHAIQRALEQTIEEAQYLTPDLGGTSGTSQMTDRVVQLTATGVAVAGLKGSDTNG